MVKKKVMVADDDQGILGVIRLILEDEGYEVLVTSNGETLKKVIDTQPHVLLLDIWMSGHDGQEICRYLKSNDDTKHIPIILFSANKDTALKAKECGADDFLAKPFEIDELLAKVQQFV